MDHWDPMIFDGVIGLYRYGKLMKVVGDIENIPGNFRDDIRDCNGETNHDDLNGLVLGKQSRDPVFPMNLWGGPLKWSHHPSPA